MPDASGEDGIGGYAFHPGTPGVVWLMADAWPDDVLAALAHAAAPRAERTSNRGVAACSMPLAELFGPWAWLPRSPTALTPTADAVISVMDCTRRNVGFVVEVTKTRRNVGRVARNSGRLPNDHE